MREQEPENDLLGVAFSEILCLALLILRRGKGSFSCKSKESAITKIIALLKAAKQDYRWEEWEWETEVRFPSPSGSHTQAC